LATIRRISRWLDILWLLSWIPTLTFLVESGRRNTRYGKVFIMTLYSLLVRFGSVGLQDKILSFIQSPLFVQPNNHYLQIKELDNNMVAVAIIELPQEDSREAVTPEGQGASEVDTGTSDSGKEGTETQVPSEPSGGSAQEATKEGEAPSQIVEPSPPAPQTTPEDEPKSRAEKGD
jgi:hypothetical protein